MRVNVLLFASLREAIGRSSIALDLTDDATVRALIATLGETYPALAPLLPSVKVAVNRGFAKPDQEIQPGDEVALLPPFGGG